MNAKKLIAILTCMLMLSLIPIAAGATTNTSQTQSAAIGGTTIFGIVTRPKLIHSGHDVEFRAIFVHYRTHNIGQEKDGNLHLLQKIILPNDYYGIVGGGLLHHMIFAHFDGYLDVD